jgi:hypothetical protein
MAGEPNLVACGVDLVGHERVGEPTVGSSNAARLNPGAIGVNGSNDLDAPLVTRVDPLRSVRFFRGQSEFKNGSTRSLCRPKCFHDPYQIEYVCSSPSLLHWAQQLQSGLKTTNLHDKALSKFLKLNLGSGLLLISNRNGNVR